MKILSAKKTVSILGFLILLFALPVALFLSRQIQYYVSKAAYKKASLVIDASVSYEKINSTWQAFAQGGEMEKDSPIPVSFQDSLTFLNQITPQYIRIDHVFDFYQPAVIENNQITSYNWQKLDKLVNNITSIGAVPFFALSYFPPQITDDGTPIGNIKNWQIWQQLVSSLVNRYSGKNQKNIPNIAYEVWNEPDLFGSWKMGYGKNYLTLYNQTAKAIKNLNNLNPLQIGGPSTTALYPAWITGLLSFAQKNNLPLDFISFHRYSQNPFQFRKDLNSAQKIISKFPNTNNLKIYITEWGPDSNPNPIYDNQYSAIHALASSIQMQQKNVLAFAFEIKDGPGAKKNYGRWGIFTHQNFGLSPKPRFFAFKFLNQLTGNTLLVRGQNSTITAIGVKDANTIKLLVVNFPQGNYTQKTVPINFTNLKNAVYSYKETGFLKSSSVHPLITVQNNTFKKTISLEPNQAILITLTKTQDLASFEPGPFGYKNDLGLIFDNKLPQITISQNNLTFDKGSIEFYLKPTFLASALSQPTIFSIPLQNNQSFLLKKHQPGFSEILTAGIFDQDQKPVFTVDTLIQNINKDGWYHLAISFDTTKAKNSFLKIYLDGQIKNQKQGNFQIQPTGNLTVGNFSGAIDELRFSSIPRDPISYYQKPLIADQYTLILRHFDGQTNK